MLVKLRQDSAELQYETAMVPCQMNRTLQDFTCRTVRRLVVALEPVLNGDLRSFLGFSRDCLLDRSCLSDRVSLFPLGSILLVLTGCRGQIVIILRFCPLALLAGRILQHLVR